MDSHSLHLGTFFEYFFRNQIMSAISTESGINLNLSLFRKISNSGVQYWLFNKSIIALWKTTTKTNFMTIMVHIKYYVLLRYTYSIFNVTVIIIQHLKWINQSKCYIIIFVVARFKIFRICGLVFMNKLHLLYETLVSWMRLRVTGKIMIMTKNSWKRFYYFHGM